METRGASRDYGVWQGEGVAEAEFLPEWLVVGWQHQDEVDAGDGTLKSHERVHQHGPPADGQELLGQVGAHAQTFASGNDDGMVLHT